MAEDVRRAERCIGLAIRKGQEEGRIAKRGQGGGPEKGHRSDRGICLPTQIVGKSELSGNGTGIYALTDDIPDERFETAIATAKAEKNLSRANVVRKVKDLDSERVTTRRDVADVRRALGTRGK